MTRAVLAPLLAFAASGCLPPPPAPPPAPAQARFESLDGEAARLKAAVACVIETRTQTDFACILVDPGPDVPDRFYTLAVDLETARGAKGAGSVVRLQATWWFYDERGALTAYAADTAVHPPGADLLDYLKARFGEGDGPFDLTAPARCWPGASFTIETDGGAGLFDGLPPGELHQGFHTIVVVETPAEDPSLPSYGAGGG